MINPGKWNELEVIKFVDFGLYLQGGDEWGEILLPLKEIPQNTDIGDKLKVFIYFDSEDRIIATTTKPLCEVSQACSLRVVAKNRLGAFLYWGLNKDLFLPYSEQISPIEVGQYVVVYIYYDEKSSRIVGTTKIEKHLKLSKVKFNEGEEVKALIYQKTDLGYKAIINNGNFGVIYHSDLFKDLNIGKRVKGYIKKVRDDYKLDITLNRCKDQEIEKTIKKILELLKQANGFLPYGDKSDPKEIYKIFSTSKKNFKRALSTLYKENKILVKDESITLVK